MGRNLPPRQEYTLNDVTFIVPVLNEEEGIGPTLDEILSLGVQPEKVIVVDGGSDDRTVDIALSKGVKVVQQSERHGGKAQAIKDGLRYAATDLVLVIDGDHTYPPNMTRDLLEAMNLGDYDEVIGVRDLSSQPILYRVGNWGLTRLFDFMFGVRLKDVLSGMYLIRREALRGALFEMKGFSVESEIVAHVVSGGGSVGEVSIKYRPRVGRKKLGIRHGFKIALDMTRLTWRYNPVTFLFLLGSLLIIPGLVLTVGGIVDFFVSHVIHHIVIMFGLIVFSMGFNSLLLALLSLYLRRMEHRLRELVQTASRQR